MNDGRGSLELVSRNQSKRVKKISAEIYLGSKVADSFQPGMKKH